MKNFKSLLSIVLSVLMVASMIVVPVYAEDTADAWDGTADTSWYSDASAEFTLTTAEQVAGLAELVNGGTTFSGKTIKLGADIQLNDTADFANWSTTAPANKWVPIGGYSSALNMGFAGTFDGQGHKVIGMYVKAKDGNVYDRVGFFGQTKNIAISNVTFENCWASGSSSGVVVGWGNAMPSFNNVDVIDSVITGNKNSVGFLLGQSGGGTFTAKNCDVSGTINGGQKVGGLFGNHQGSTVGLDVDNCTIDVTIVATGGTSGDKNGYVGAVVGCLGYSTSNAIGNASVKNTTVNADITTTRDFGAVIGCAMGSSINSVTFENLDVDASLTPSGSSVNYQGIAMLLGYAQAGGGVSTITVKNVEVKGDMGAGQNSGIVVGRASGPIGTIKVEDLASDVVVNITKGSSGNQCIGGIVGLAQKDIVSLTVDGYTSTNTYAADANGASQVGDLIGATSTKIGTVAISDANVDAAFTGAISKVGGLLGNAAIDKVTISSSDIKTNIDSTGANIGGVVVTLKDGATLTIEDTTVDVTAKGSENVGGLFAAAAGAVALTVSDSEIKANVDGGETAGGIANSIAGAESIITATNSTFDVTSTGKTLVATTEATLSYKNVTITPADEANLGMDIVEDTTLGGGDDDDTPTYTGWDGTVDTSWYTDGPTEFTLTTPAQLAGLAELVNAGNAFKGKTIKLGADMQLNDTTDFANWSLVPPANVWTSIGAYNIGSFQGNFDGDGHTISGMYATNASDPTGGKRAGLFGYTYNKVYIENLTMEKCFTKADTCAAILVGFASNDVPSFANVTTVDCVVKGGGDGTGILAGKTGGYSVIEIENCSIAGTVTATQYAGGFIGYITGGTNKNINVVNTETDITVNATNASGYSGGLFGTIGRGTASTFADLNVVNDDGVARTIKVNVTSGRDFGGIVGYLNCKSVGNLTFDGITVDATVDSSAFTSVNYQGIAALVGYINNGATNSINVKDTTITGELYIGQNSGVAVGRAAKAIGSINIENVVTDVDFFMKKGTGNTQCNGFIGLAQGNIDEIVVDGYTSTNTYTVTDTNGADNIGDIIGSCSGKVGSISVSGADVDVTITGAKSYIGGLIGNATSESITVADSDIKAAITASAGKIGGIVSNLKANTTFEMDGTTVDVTLKGSDNVGGLFGQSVGNLAVTITDSDIKANVEGGETAGAIAGSIEFEGSVVKATNVTFDVTSTGKTLTGATDAKLTYKNVTITPDDEAKLGMELVEDTTSGGGEGTGCTCTKKADWTAWRVDKAMVCAPGHEEAGHSYRTCKRCGGVEEKVIPVEHMWSVWNNSCTLDTDGDGKVNATRTCAACHTVETSATPVDVVHVDTSWTSDVDAALYCNDCGKLLTTTSGVVEGGTTTTTYTDIAGHKYEADIMFVTEYGLFNGMGNGLFQPNTTMTRGMIVTVLARLAGVNVLTYKNNFVDVAADSYYAPYVGWAEAVGITNGYGDGTFRPDTQITKEQAIAMIARYLTHIGNNDTTSNNKADFTDLNTGSDWAKDIVAEAIRLGIIENDATTFRPTASATRAELANFFANVVDYLTK